MSVALAHRSPIGGEGVDFDPTRDTRYQFARAAREIAEWQARLELEGKATRTRDDYLRSVNVLVTMFDRDLADFTTAEVTHCINAVPPKSRYGRRAHLQSLFSTALLLGWIDRNPLDLVPKIKRPKRPLIPTFSEAEVELLTGLPLPDGALFQILFDAGLRRGEACRLMVEHVNLDRQTLTVFGGKGDKDRVVPMTDRLTHALVDLITIEGLNRGDWFWYCAPGGRRRQHNREIIPSVFARWYRRALKVAAVEYQKPHTTRHTCATLWCGWGLPIQEVKRILGHENLETTTIYVHPANEDIAANMRAVLEAQRDPGATDVSTILALVNAGATEDEVIEAIKRLGPGVLGR